MGSCSLISCACVALVVLQLLKKMVPWIYENFIGPQILGSKIDLRSMGQWAVVTGGTDGIGKAYAKALASRRINVVIISRSQEKLDRVADELKNMGSVQFKTIAVDFTQGADIYDKIEKEIAGLEIGILINNVGMCYEHPEYFLSLPNRNSFLRDLVSCNIHSVTHMCSLILPQMVERKKGVIVNISSLSAVVPSPLLTAYAATKAFVDKFSVDLNTEYRSQGIHIQSVLPGFVATNMSKIKKDSFLAPCADFFVGSAIQTLGISTRTTGYIGHALMKLASDTLTAVTCVPAVNSFALKAMLNIRNKSLKRKTK